MSNTWGILSKFVHKPSATVELNNLFLNMEFDVITSEQHRWSAEVTSNPVESGESVADHIGLNADTLDIQGVISNASLSRWKGAFVEKLLGMIDKESNVQRAFDQLRKLFENRQPVTVYTRYRTYPDMVLTTLSIPRTTEGGDAIEFSASFQKIKRVATLTVDAADAGIYPAKASEPAIKRKSEPVSHNGQVSTTMEQEQAIQVGNKGIELLEEQLKKNGSFTDNMYLPNGGD